MNNSFTGKCNIEIHPDNLSKTGPGRFENAITTDMVPEPPKDVFVQCNHHRNLTSPHTITENEDGSTTIDMGTITL